MNPFKSLISFFIFLAFFCASLALRYSYFVYSKALLIDSYTKLCGTLLVSGIFLGLAMHFLKIKPHQRFSWVGLGIVLTFLIFAGVSLSEDAISEIRLVKNSTPGSFADLERHCGIYAGRSLLKIAHHELSPAQMGIIQEFELNNTCRNRHYAFLVSKNLLRCASGENQMDCRISWMHAFSERGIWNLQTRKLFNAEVMNLYPKVKNEESLVKYVIKDQELEAGRVSLIRQAGIDEEFADLYLRLNQKDELENLKLSEKIFLQTSQVLEVARANPPPYLLKYQDLRTEIQPKLARIPELEKDVANLNGL